MKKLLLTLVVLLFGSMSFPAASFAAGDSVGLFDVCNQADAAGSSTCAGRDGQKGNPISGPDGIIVKITNLIAYAAGIAAVVLLIIAGIKYITSQGDSAGVKAAKTSLINVFIGIVIIVLGRQFIVYIVSRI